MFRQETQVSKKTSRPFCILFFSSSNRGTFEHLDFREIYLPLQIRVLLQSWLNHFARDILPKWVASDALNVIHTLADKYGGMQKVITVMVYSIYIINMH